MLKSMRKFLFIALCLFLHITTATLLDNPNEKITELVDEIKKEVPNFEIGAGISMSQTHLNYPNTIRQGCMADLLLQTAAKQKNPALYVTNPDRIGYFAEAIKHLYCPACQQYITQNQKIELTQFATYNNWILTNKKGSTTWRCPIHKCCLQLEPKETSCWTTEHENALAAQINYINPYTPEKQYPNGRISTEMAAVLDQNGTLNQEKINQQALFIKKLGNPLLFCHHYANPEQMPDLFATEEGSNLFKQYVIALFKACQKNGVNITHICPISQPVGFAQRVTRGSLPPFSSKVSADEMIKNMTIVQKEIAKEIKEMSPDTEILFSHQWKLFKPYHNASTSYLDMAKCAFERLICAIAHKKYNGAFVSSFASVKDNFDGIALSVYPALKFDGISPIGSNCSDNFDKQEIFDTIMQTHAQFPDKNIYIVETGCNTKNSEKKQEFIHATLHAIKVAIEHKAPIKGLYFWGVCNDPKTYYEWNHAEGSTHFGFFNEFNLENPCSSATPAGEILHSLNQPKI